MRASIVIRFATAAKVLLSNVRPWSLYLEGLGFRSIGRVLNCSHVAVYTWIKAFGESIDTLRSAAGVAVIEMDELHSYIGAKKTPAGSGWLWIAMQNNSSTAYWVPAIRPRASNYGRPSRATPSTP